MSQHPKVTVGWAVACLERALDDLGDSGAEARVRRQFHQLVLALERDGHMFLDGPMMFARPTRTLTPLTPGSPNLS
jgi:hypothetical protein